MQMCPLPQAFYARNTEIVARELLGCVLQTQNRGVVTSGRIVEVEAYVGPHDPAAHGFGNRRTPRTEPMFGPPGFAYVYFTYGMHWCVNTVTEQEGFPAAVLIRALEPLKGQTAMMRRRQVRAAKQLCSGPARLCQALGINGKHNTRSLVDERICVLPRDVVLNEDQIVAGPRIGISKAVDWPLRFCLRHSPWLSRSGQERTNDP